MASASSPSVAQGNGTDPSAPIRIKRNTACIRCRDAKVSLQTPSKKSLASSRVRLDVEYTKLPVCPTNTFSGKM